MNDFYINHLIRAIYEAVGMQCIVILVLVGMFGIFIVSLLERMKFELIAIREILTEIKNAPLNRRNRDY